MPHSDILKVVLIFEGVLPGQSQTKDHGISIKGVSQLPDHIHYDNGVFSVTGNQTSVTVTNNGSSAANVDVLVEHWHSIPRVFGDVNQDSLAVRPYISGPGAPPGTDQDEKVKVSADDTATGFLSDKLVAGANVSLAILNPGDDEDVEISVTVPGAGSVVKRSLYKDDCVSTSGNSYVDGMSGGSVVVPADGDYLVVYEGESKNSRGNGILELGISVNSVVAVVADSERSSGGRPNRLRSIVSSVQLHDLEAGDLVRMLLRKQSGSQSVFVMRRHLSILKVQ